MNKFWKYFIKGFKTIFDFAPKTFKKPSRFRTVKVKQNIYSLITKEFDKVRNKEDDRN